MNGSAGEGAVYVFYKPARGWANETDAGEGDRLRAAPRMAASGQGAALGKHAGWSALLMLTVGGTLAQGAADVFAGGWGWPQSVTDSVSPAALSDTSGRQAARPCTPHAAHDRALTPRVPLRASRNRPER